MCLGSGDTDVKMPDPPKQADPIPAAPPPDPIQSAPKPLTEPGETVDIRIGAAKESTSRRDRDTSTSGANESLTIGNNQGLTI